MLKTLLQQGILEPVFYCDLVYIYIILKELFVKPYLVINFKGLLNVIEEWDTTWISCDSLHT